MYLNTNTFRTAIIAGAAVGIAGWGYLACTNIIGAVLFSFGLLTVVGYKLPLYTGTAGFIPLRDEQGRSCWMSAIAQVLFILLGHPVSTPAPAWLPAYRTITLRMPQGAKTAKSSKISSCCPFSYFISRNPAVFCGICFYSITSSNTLRKKFCFFSSCKQTACNFSPYASD